MRVEEFHYKVPWRAKGIHPGHHHGSYLAGGFEFRDYLRLMDAPDPRRIDIRASLRDPFERLLVRAYTQKTAVPVYALADLSASMGFRGRFRRLDVLADFIASLGYSTYRTGDPFAFIGCDQEIRHEFCQPLTRVRAAASGLAQRLRHFEPEGKSSDALAHASRIMGRRGGLVFLLSDFYFSCDLLERVLVSLARHSVVPVVFTDSHEHSNLPVFGMAQLVDSESGQRRTLLMRPALKNKIRARFERHMSGIVGICRRHGARPLLIEGSFDPKQVTRHFYT
jgi:uncharacterized protein (DUF58 family)